MNENVSRVEQIGALVAGSALLALGAKRGGWTGLAAAIAGGSLCAHGVTRKSPLYRMLGIDSQEDGVSHPLNRTVHVRDAIVVNKPVDEVRRFWTDFDNMPRFMRDVESVEKLDCRRSRWRMSGPMGKSIEWEAELVEPGMDNAVKWRTIASESDVEHEGSVRFEPATGNRGTIVRVDFRWSPPAGVLGAVAAKLMPQDPKRRVREDLRCFRQLIETGEIATSKIEAQRDEGDRASSTVAQRDPVDEAGVESFPASDAPAIP